MDILLWVSVAIKALAIIMVLWTFHSVSEHRFPKLDALEKYHLMRKRYEHLRLSLLFVVALILIQLGGMFVYAKSGVLAPVLISDAVMVALVLFLTVIYKERSHIEDIELKKK